MGRSAAQKNAQKNVTTTVDAGTSPGKAPRDDSKASKPLYHGMTAAQIGLACKLATMVAKRQDVKTEPCTGDRQNVELTTAGRVKGYVVRGSHNQARTGLAVVGPEIVARQAGLPDNWMEAARAFQRDQEAGLVF